MYIYIALSLPLTFVCLSVFLFTIPVVSWITHLCFWCVFSSSLSFIKRPTLLKQLFALSASAFRSWPQINRMSFLCSSYILHTYILDEAAFTVYTRAHPKKAEKSLSHYQAKAGPTEAESGQLVFHCHFQCLTEPIRFLASLFWAAKQE